jgi:hypothetical protein
VTAGGTRPAAVARQLAEIVDLSNPAVYEASSDTSPIGKRHASRRGARARANQRIQSSRLDHV